MNEYIYSNLIKIFIDDCRFDIRVNDCVWYLRAETPEMRQKWLDFIKEQHFDHKLSRTGSLRSTFSAASISRASTTSYKVSLIENDFLKNE